MNMEIEADLKVIQVDEIISSSADQVWSRCCNALDRALCTERIGQPLEGTQGSWIHLLRLEMASHTLWAGYVKLLANFSCMSQTK